MDIGLIDYRRLCVDAQLDWALVACLFGGIGFIGFLRVTHQSEFCLMSTGEVGTLITALCETLSVTCPGGSRAFAAFANGGAGSPYTYLVLCEGPKIAQILD